MARETCLYSKPVYKQSYLTYPIKSEHSISVKAILYGLGIRLKWVPSRDEDYQREKKKLVSQLRKRGYPSRLIKGQLLKIDTRKREDLLVDKQ